MPRRSLPVVNTNARPSTCDFEASTSLSAKSVGLPVWDLAALPPSACSCQCPKHVEGTWANDGSQTDHTWPGHAILVVDRFETVRHFQRAMQLATVAPDGPATINSEFRSGQLWLRQGSEFSPSIAKFSRRCKEDAQHRIVVVRCSTRSVCYVMPV